MKEVKDVMEGKLRAMKKECTKCHFEKSTDEFYKAKDKKDGFRSNCKECISKEQRAYRQLYRLNNPEKVKVKAKVAAKARAVAWQEMSVEQKREHTAAVMEWKKNNPEKVRETTRRYYERHKKEVLASNADWKGKNAEKIKAYRHLHKEEIKQRQHEYYMKNRERIWGYLPQVVKDENYYLQKQERARLLQKRYAETNKEKLRTYRAKWYQDNKGRIYEKRRLWEKAHPERVKELRREKYLRDKAKGKYLKKSPVQQEI